MRCPGPAAALRRLCVRVGGRDARFGLQLLRFLDAVAAASVRHREENVEAKTEK